MQKVILQLFFVSILLISPTTTYSQDETPPPDAIIHVVQRGETLYRIAQQYGLTIEQLARANNIANPGNIVVGQRLIIPSASFVPMATETPQVHIVRAGESLSRIAQLYQMTVDALASMNNITDVNALYVGQVLAIAPNTTPPISPTPESIADAGIITVVSPNATQTTIAYTVQRGDTLYRIAQRYGITSSAIQQANQLIDPSRILVGQQLLIPITTIQINSASDLPELVQLLDIFPLRFTEGQSGRILLRTTLPVTVSGTFLDAPLNPIGQENNLVTFILIAVPIYTPEGIYPLNLTITPNVGDAVNLVINIQVQSGNYGSQYITLPADRLDLLNVGVEENEITILRNVTRRVNPERYFSGAMSLPAAAVMNSPYGTRRAYNGGAFDRYHNGTDFAGASGSPVMAAQAGRVVLADVLNIRGISVVIDHGVGCIYQLFASQPTLCQFRGFCASGAGDRYGGEYRTCDRRAFALGIMGEWSSGQPDAMGDRVSVTINQKGAVFCALCGDATYS